MYFLIKSNICVYFWYIFMYLIFLILMTSRERSEVTDEVVTLLCPTLW